LTKTKVISIVSSHAIIKCPFCNKLTIEAIYKPSYLGHHTSRILAGAKTTYFRVPESYEILSGCSACGKSKKEVQKAFDTGATKELSHEERLKRLKKSGLPLKITTEYKKKAIERRVKSNR